MKLSIITTVYQAEKDLPRLLDSMMAVKSQDVEFFLIDNGSTDNSNKICKEYAEKDPRFVIHRLEENIGYIRARNFGLDTVEADYVGFCDSDDYLDSEGYDKAIDCLKKSNCDVFIGTWYTVIDDNLLLNSAFTEEGIYKNENLKKIIPQFYGPINNHPAVQGFVWKEFIKKSIIDDKKYRFNLSLKPLEDLVFNAMIINDIKSLEVRLFPVYYYVISNNSITEITQNNFDYESYFNRIVLLINELSYTLINEKVKIALANTALLHILSFLSKCIHKLGFFKTYHILNEYSKGKKISQMISNSKTSLKLNLFKFLLYYNLKIPLLFLLKIKSQVKKLKSLN